MLAKIFGMFTLKRPLMKSITVMLMENTIQTKQSEALQATFDLKGSTHGRKSKGTVKPTTVQKDLDFMAAKHQNKKLFEMNILNRKLKNILQKDTQFLIQNGFLDYSLLVAIEKNDSKFDSKAL